MAESIIIHVAINVISSVISTAIKRSADHNFSSLREIHGKVRTLEINLRLIQRRLKNIQQNQNKSQRSRWETDGVHEQIQRVAYDAQDVFDQLFWYQQQLSGPQSSSLPIIKRKCESILKLPQIGEWIDDINRSISDINNEITNALKNISLEEGTAGQADNQRSNNSGETLNTEMVDQVIGFDDQIKKIRTLICKNDEKPSIISIVGMGGIGKSTLARIIFTDSEVKNLFRMRIWIGISDQEYNVQIKSEGVKKMTGGEVREMLIESLDQVLENERCLIVIDGIWEESSWKEINHGNSIFSKISNGSRIIQTTRKLDVAKSNVNETPNCTSDEHEVELLDDEKSWELLRKRGFQSNAMNSEQTKSKLESLRKDLTQKCKGLPLALIALGDHISSNLTNQTWSRKPDEIDWDNLKKDGINISQSLSLSYDDLPPRLKPIFLYITCFPADQFIRVSELVKLWIAEQFIPFDDGPQETKAREFVEELHQRSLVMVKKRSEAHQWITRIMVHDVLRDWGRAIAKKEKFLSVIKSTDSTGHAELARDFYRVALHGYRVGDLANPMPNLRSLLGFRLPEKEIASAGLISPHIVTFNPNGPIKKSPECIKPMIFLRYICLRNFIEINLPSSIEQVYRLQTLDCRGSTMNCLPDKLWKIPTLRHVYLNVRCDWNGPGRGSGRNLRSLYIYDRPSKKSKDRWKLFKYTGLNAIADAVDEMAGIVALRLISGAGSLPRNILSKISTLSSLEVLELREECVVNKETGLSKIPREYGFPENLIKIKLGCSNLVNDPMLFLGVLKKLAVLELSNVKLDSMYSSGNSFPELKYLTIVNFWGEELGADAGAMPNLRHLKLDGCTKLKRLSGKFREHNDLIRELTNGTPRSI